MTLLRLRGAFLKIFFRFKKVILSIFHLEMDMRLDGQDRKTLMTQNSIGI